jgi:hypothetical protein
VALLLAWPGTAAATEPFYLGRWTIASVERGPWTCCHNEESLAALQRLVGSPVLIGPRAIEGPEGVGCRAGYQQGGATAYTMFEGGLHNVTLPPEAPAAMANASGDYYDPQKLAERFGFRGFSWKALRCDKDWYLFFADPKNAAARVDQFIVMLKRE